MSDTLELTWSGGEQPYLVYRSADPKAVVTAATRIAVTSESDVVVPLGPGPVDFFLVVNVDRASAATITSACLTAGTAARSAVEVELRDSLGHPLEGAAVAMTTDVGALGPVVPDGAVYRAVLTSPEIANGPATIGITADGATLLGQPSVAIAGPLTGTDGGAGGCPADGNLRVRVVDETGLPISGANVMVGSFEALDAFSTVPGGAPDGPNTGFTDPDGYVEFVDFGANLDGPQTLTAAAEDRRYLTLVDVDAADAVLPLAAVDASEPAGTFEGDVTNVPAPPNDPIELAVMVPDLSFETILSFRLDALFADSECYDAGGVAGSSPLPGNVFIPAQCALQIFICLQQLPQHPYRSPDVPYGDRRLLAIRAEAPLEALTSDDFSQALQSISLNGIGVVPFTVASPGPSGLDIPITDALQSNLDCTIDGAPANSDVSCVAAGDWDSALDPDLPPGAGRLFAMGFRFGDSAGTTAPFVIDGVTTVARTGDFSDIDYLGAAVAQYLDPAKPGIPPGTASGTSAILDRSGTSFDGAGGALTFDRFFPVRTLSRRSRSFTLAALPGTGHPEPTLTRVVLSRAITETYNACVADDSTRTIEQVLWEIYLPGPTESWELPTPPIGWPRQEFGGDLAGLVDPAATPEDDRLEHAAATFHLETPSGYDYDRLRFSDIRLRATHVTRNVVDY
jgi:hypothetical protein